MTFTQRQNRLTMQFSERIPIVKRRMTVTSLQSHLTHNPPDGDSMFFQHNAWHFHMVKNNCGGGNDGGGGDDDDDESSVTDKDNEEQEHVTVIKNKLCSP